MKNNILVLVISAFSSFAFAQGADISNEIPAGAVKVEIGTFKSRAYWIPSATADQPTVVMIPGSGPNGPEEVAPPAQTIDSQFHSLFGPYASAFVKAGYNVLMLGKPGVEYFTDGDMKKWLYDVTMYQATTWNDLVANVSAGLDYVAAQPNINTQKIYLMGHSEGTQVAIDYTMKNSSAVAGLFLLAYWGQDMATTADWQLYKRDIEFWLAPDVDTDKNAAISQTEASLWPELSWLTQALVDASLLEISLADYEQELRSIPDYQAYYEQVKNKPLYKDVFNRGPLYELTATLTQPVYVINGEKDVATPVSQVMPLETACKKIGKTNYSIEIIPDLGHGFSELKGPRKHALLDNTMGPVAASFLKRLEEIAKDAIP